MPDVKLHVLRGPTKPGPYEDAKKTARSYFTGGGDTNYLCGVCGFPVMRDVKAGQGVEIGLLCEACGAQNCVAST